MRKRNALTARQVRTFADGLYGDGGNLYLRVAGDSRTWVFRYQMRGRTLAVGLGSIHTRSLADARRLAAELRLAVANGRDPKARLRELTGKGRPHVTFAEVAAEMVESKRAGWRNPKHAQQWMNTLRTYAFPTLGDKPPGAITLVDVANILRPLWTTKTETASRLRGRIEAVLDYAAVHGYRTGDNPARWRGNLDKVLPPRAKVAAVKHFAAINWRELPAVYARLCESEGMAALCLRFIILTASRSSEARGATHDEIDTAAAVWAVPAARMKAARPHRVPLSPAAIAVLQVAASWRVPDCNLVFPGGRRGRPLSDVAVSKALHRIAPSTTIHGLRAAFRTWVEEATDTPRSVAEAALAHRNPDKIEAAYQRSDLFDRRRDLMNQWAQFVVTKK